MAEPSEFSDARKIGKYIIESELGHGAMGTVYKGFDPLIERHVALKTIRKDLLNSKDIQILLSRFRQEAKAAGSLNHPNIVSVYEYGEQGDSVFIAMEFVKGHELKEYFDKDKRFDISDIIRVMSQILGALAYSHEQGVVHRDIKPANILIMDNGQVKITDFGIAHIESSELTQTGTVIGTPNYMSPEQIMGQRVDGRSDLFSAGVILYQLITGENPFPGKTMATIMHRILNSDPIDASHLNVQVSKELNQALQKSIEKKPEDRYQTAEAFFAAIEKAILGDDVRERPVATDDNAKSPNSTVILNPSDKNDESLKSIPFLSKESRGRRLRPNLAVVFVGVLVVVFLAAWLSYDGHLSEKEFGYVNLITKPWATVYIDGQSYGNTPIANLKIPTGKKEIRFVNKDKNIDIIKTVIVKPDEILRKRFELME